MVGNSGPALSSWLALPCFYLFILKRGALDRTPAAGARCSQPAHQPTSRPRRFYFPARGPPLIPSSCSNKEGATNWKPFAATPAPPSSPPSFIPSGISRWFLPEVHIPHTPHTGRILHWKQRSARPRRAGHKKPRTVLLPKLRSCGAAELLEVEEEGLSWGRYTITSEKLNCRSRKKIQGPLAGDPEV